MGSRTIISGYIEIPAGSEARNEALLADFAFDPVYPFTNAFSGPKRGYRGSTLSFATGIKAVPEEWHEWRERFEQLLGVLECNAAQARFEFEDGNVAADYNYVFAEFFSGDAPPPRAAGRRRCTRFLSEPGDDSEEVELLL